MTEIITRILLETMDVKRAFGKIGILPEPHNRSHSGQCRAPDWWGLLASAMQEAHRATIWALVGASAAAKVATGHEGVARSTRKAIEPLPPGCQVPRVRGEGERAPAWVLFFVGDDSITGMAQGGRWHKVQRVDSKTSKRELPGDWVERRGGGFPRAEGEMT